MRLDLFLTVYSLIKFQGSVHFQLKRTLASSRKKPFWHTMLSVFFCAEAFGESTSTLDSRDAPSLTAISTGSNLHELLGGCKRCNKNASNKKNRCISCKMESWKWTCQMGWKSRKILSASVSKILCCQQSWGRAPANHVLGFGNPQAACPKQCLAKVLWWFNSRTCKGLVQKVPFKDGKSFRPNPQRQDQGVNFGFTCP